MKFEVINNLAKKEDVDLVIDMIREFIEYGTNNLNLNTRKKYEQKGNLHYKIGLQKKNRFSC